MVHFITIHKKIIVLLSLLLMVVTRVDAAVQSHVNSGNPAFPFPQFLDYGEDRKSLASHNAPGVTHAEMEKRMLDAWQHICNGTKLQGYEVDGVQYLIPDASVVEDHCGCAEGDGYYLLGAAFMGDKTYFDGYYMSMHDRMFIGVDRFVDGGTNVYDGYSRNLNGAGSNRSGSAMTIGNYAAADGSATDGDVDIALALLVAAKQWGEHSGIMTRFGELNYNEEALKYIRAMVDTVPYANSNYTTYVSGVVGFDGYLKGGSHQTQLTTWGGKNSNIVYHNIPAEYGGTEHNKFDYLAPAYFNEYWKFLELDDKSTDWQINQCKRCEVSSDWLMGKLYEEGEEVIPFCGTVQSAGSDQAFEFGQFMFSEDFRACWRTILHYVWHGTPTMSWDPVNHEPVETPNNIEKDMALRFAKFLANPQASPWNNSCNAVGDMAEEGLSFWGPYTIRLEGLDKHGKLGEGFPYNWLHGTASPTAIAAQDFELMGQLFRQCTMVWDDDDFRSYETSTPRYFHEWFKLLGMLVLSGNFHAPSMMLPNANVKVYHKVDKTYAFAGDEVTFTVSIRNYGSVDAANTVVKFGIPEGFTVVKTSAGNVVGDSVVWEKGTVPGVKSATGIKPTMDSIQIVCRLNDNIEQGRYCTSARVYCDNGFGWTSDEYPNNITTVMERNCVDVVARALNIEKKCNREQINPDNIAQFTINFENSAKAGWINGGRPGVRLSYGHLAVNNPSNTQDLVAFYRLFHDADEAYIDYGNYRVSYYMYDPNLTCFAGDADCSTGWNMAVDYYQGGDKNRLKVYHETTVEGEDPLRPGKKYNQRIIVQFSNQLAAITQHLQQYSGNGNAQNGGGQGQGQGQGNASGGGDGLHVHEGGGATLLINTRMSCSQGGKTFDLTDDWSYDESWTSSKQNDLHYPITDDHTDPYNAEGEKITTWDRHSCGTANKTVDRILVEEWDGYTWRRILGNGPMPGRDVYNVVVRDTLPIGMEFVEFVGACPLEDYGGSWRTFKSADGRDVVEWTIDRMMINQTGKIVYNANVTFPSGKSCQTADELIENKAWIWGDKESAINDTAKIIVTCSKVPDPVIPTTMTKEADKANYEVGDDITYTIGYKQTHGAVFDKAEKMSSDWNLSQWSASGGALTSTPNVSGTASFTKSKGNNCYVTMDVDPTSYAFFQMIFREGSSKPISVEINPQIQQNQSQTLNVTVYEGGSVKMSTKEVIVKGSANPFNIVVDLTGDLLRLWVNRDTSVGPALSVSGLSLGVGNFALKNGGMGGASSHGSHKISNIHVHTDYAYDLSIVDLVPAEVEVDESSFQSFHNGSAAGTGKLLKGADGDSIVWTDLANNPIAFGDTFTVKWKGKVKECSERIINLSKAKLLGHAHNEIMAQAVSGCGEACPLPNVSLAISNDEICAGDSAILVAGPTGSYTYKFYENGQLLDSTNSNIFVTKPIAAGRYKYSVEVVSRLTLLPCYSPSDTLILMVNKLPVGSNFQLDPFCKGNADVTAFEKEVNKMTTDGVSYSWLDENGNPTTQPDINGLTEAGDYKFSYTLTTQSGCVSRQPSTLEFTLRAISGPTGTGMVSYILGDTASNGKFDKNLLQQDPSVVDVENGYTYNWYDENYQPLQGAPIPDVPAAGATVTYHYYVNRTQPVGCVSDTFPVTVVVSGSTVPVPVNVSYCLNETAQPITATVSEVSDSNASWEVVYYDSDGNELTSESARTPNTTTAGTITYYVSQREVGNSANESGKVPLVVTVVEVPLPDVSMNRTQYCKGEQYEPLQVKSNFSLYDANRSSFSWSVDGNSVTGVPLAQTQTEVVSYGVVESYEIESGHVCVSDTVKFAVKSTFVPVATGSLSVNYLKSEAAADGSFESLLSKDPSAVTASDNSDYELVWFDDALNELGTTDPSPVKDNSWVENEDVRLTYFVKQRHKESGCLSDTVRVTVILSDALVPNTFPMNYCHHARAFSLENNASINTNRGQVRDIDYELVWFSPEDNYASPLAAAPVPSTETVGVTIYKVAQKHKDDGTVSTKAEVKVTVFPNPEIKVDALPQTCGEEIEISKYIHLANTVDTSLLNYYYFTDRNCVNPLSELTLTESTVFYANAYYTIFSEPNIIGYCASDTIEMNATIDDLTNLVVDAPSSVCPNGDIHLKASATSTTSSVSYEWSGAATGSADVLDTKDESGVFGEVHSYHLTASAGACYLDTTVSVTVGKGELTGDVLANNQITHNLKICDGEPVELSTTHDGQDFKWSDLSGGIVGSGKDVSVTPATTTTYVLSFVNKCETSDTVVVEVYPLSLTADFTLLDTSICEKSTASAVLTINGYDPSMTGSYIKWMKNGGELAEFAGQTTLRLDNVDKDDSGEYTYEVSNGICLAKTSDVKTTAQLEVKPYVLFAEPTTVLVPHGGSSDLTIIGLTPSDATVSWKGDLHDGVGNPFTVTDMEKDELFAVTLSANGYCDSETEVQVLVDAKAVVSISVSADVVCVEDGVTITADTTGTGHLLYPDKYQLTWYSLDGESNLSKLSADGLSIHDYPQSSVSYYVVVNYGDQEAVSDTLAVEIVSPAVYTVTEDAVSCSGDEVTIEVSSEEEGVEVEWTEDGTKASSIVVAPIESRSYSFVITKKGLCPVTDQIPVSVKEKPTVAMDEEKTVCEGSDIVVSPTVTGKEYSGFVWTDPEGEIISRELKLVTAPTLSGDYTLMVQTSSCGDASASVNVKVIPTPVLYIDSLSFTTRKIEVVSGGFGTFEYKMDKQEWQSDNLYENLAYKVLHTAYVRDEMGCVGVTVFNITQPPVPIPEYFTPDGSGQNEVWDVTPILDAYPKSTVKIFDRTGKVIAELDGSMSDWDGTYNGNPLPSTDYWYIINVPEIRQQFTGHFTLIRGK